MFSSKQTRMFDYFICYHLESGWHVTRPNQGLSLGRGKSLGTRLAFCFILLSQFGATLLPFHETADIKPSVNSRYSEIKV